MSQAGFEPATYALRIRYKKRLENGSFLGEDYFEQLLEEIREIRLSERRFYQKITDIYATVLITIKIHPWPGSTKNIESCSPSASSATVLDKLSIRDSVDVFCGHSSYLSLYPTFLRFYRVMRIIS